MLSNKSKIMLFFPYENSLIQEMITVVIFIQFHCQTKNRRRYATINFQQWKIFN